MSVVNRIATSEQSWRRKEPTPRRKQSTQAKRRATKMTSWKQICTCKPHNIKQVWSTKTSHYHITATSHYYRKTFCSYILVVHFTASTIWGL